MGGGGPVASRRMEGVFMGARGSWGSRSLGEPRPTFFLIVNLEAFLIGNLHYNISDEGFKKPRSDRVGCPVAIVDGTKLTNKTLEKLLLCYAVWVPVFLFRISRKIL